MLQIEHILAARKLDFKYVASQLFPKNRHPKAALQRVVKGQGTLTAEQLSKLAAMADVNVQELFAVNWSIAPVQEAYTLTFTRGRYTAHLNLAGGRTRILDGETLIHETLLHSTSITLTEYIEAINELLKLY